MPIRSIISLAKFGILAPAAAISLLGAACTAPEAASPPVAPPAADPDFAATLLAAHNSERRIVGVPPLAWSNRLAARAAAYAPHLAAIGILEHSPRSSRGYEGENLWMGTADAYSLEAMVAGWAREKRHYRPGRYPGVSATGSSADVGHYTQMVWRDTREVGCARLRGGRWDYLVCRYVPPGNVIGQRAF